MLGVLFLVAAFLLAYYCLTKPKVPKGYEWASDIPALTLVQGLRLAFCKDTHFLLAEFAQKHGPLFKINNPDGGVRMLVVSDPAAARVAMKSEVKGNFYDPFKKFHEPVLFLGEGDWWRKQRRLTGTMFSGTSVRSLYPMLEETQVMFDNINSKPSGIPIDADDLFCRLTLDVIGRALYGESFGAQSGKKVALTAALNEGLSEIQKRLSNPIRGLLVGTDRLVENMRTVHSYGWKAIEKRRATPHWEGIKDMLTILLTNVDPETGDKMPDDQIARELGAFIAAGHEASSHALAWALYHLMHHPEVADKCREELDRVMEDRKLPTLDDLQKLTMIDFVLKETLRLTHVSPMGAARELVEDEELCGYVVPKGTSIWVPFHPMMVDPKLWHEPLAFKPERFRDVPSGDPKYIPFAAGPRTCLGKAMAKQELQLVLAAVIRNYTFRMAPGAKVKAALEITLRPRGLLVIFEPRCLTISPGQS